MDLPVRQAGYHGKQGGVRIVLDANVVVSGFLNPYHPPGVILQLVADGTLVLCYDARILAEYRTVLLRPAFRLDPAAIDDFLAQVETEGCLAAARPLSARLPDLSDEPFLEVALAAHAEHLVTGNLRHFPAGLCRGLSVIQPAGCLDLFRKSF